MEKIKSDRSLMDDDSYGAQMLERVSAGNISINYGLLLAHPTYSNLNPLQYAALVGDIEFLELLLAQGAAVDYPALANPPKHEHFKSSKAPRGSTALVWATSSLALPAKTGPHPVMFPFGIGNIENMVECCIRLVMVGADYKKKLNVPVSSSLLPNQLLRQFHGMSVQQLASASGKTKLIEAIAYMEEEDKFAGTQCRCGSRLPWNECHGFGRRNKSLVSIQDDQGVVYWGCSPLLRYPCQPLVGDDAVAAVINKTYMDCCWNKKAHFLNDTTGEFLKVSSDGIPLVCCAAVYCQKIESKPKKFAVCSRCKLYAYCSKGRFRLNSFERAFCSAFALKLTLSIH